MSAAPSAASNGAGEAIGVDLGGTKMLVGVIADGPKVLHRSEAASVGLGVDELLDTLEAELRAALESRPSVEAIGLGIPCTIDRKRGLAISAVNLPIVDVPIRDLMTERLGTPVVDRQRRQRRRAGREPLGRGARGAERRPARRSGPGSAAA